MRKMYAIVTIVSLALETSSILFQKKLKIHHI
jgi:hypothetical protein